MSAYIIEPETMHKVVAAADAMSRARQFEMANVIVPEDFRIGERDKSLTELGRALYRMNAEAIRQRYGDDVFGLPEYQYKPFLLTGQRDLIACYKAARCLQYQCYEGNVPETRSFQQLADLISRLADAIIMEMPEYRQAAWG